jgi:hypothetical protein
MMHRSSCRTNRVRMEVWIARFIGLTIGARNLSNANDDSSGAASLERQGALPIPVLTDDGLLMEVRRQSRRFGKPPEAAMARCGGSAAFQSGDFVPALRRRATRAAGAQCHHCFDGAV